MDDLELSMLVSLFVVLVHMLMEIRPSYEADDHLASDFTHGDYTSQDMHLALSSAVLHDVQLSSGLLCTFDDLRYWVKPRCTVWFHAFLMNAYDDSRWIAHFRMGKSEVAQICHTLCPLVAKLDTNYRRAIPPEIRICCALYKLAQGAKILACSEMFAIGRATVGKVLREVVQGICIKYKHLIQWPVGHRLREVMHEFKDFCGLPSVHGAIDCTHIEIARPKQFPEDYYYYKSSCYTMVLQATVDAKKRFTNIFVGLPGSVNDMRVLRRSGLYRWAQHRQLMHMCSDNSLDGIPPFLLGDKGYPLLSWILTPHKDRNGEARTVLETLFNKQHRRGRSVVENTFALLKQVWREVGSKSDLDVRILPDVVSACCILHNFVMGAQDTQIQQLMRVIAVEATNALYEEQQVHEQVDAAHAAYNARLESGEVSGADNRRLVEAYLGTQRCFQL